MNPNKNAKVKGRKFHGSPHLKLKKVKVSPRRTHKQRLRKSIDLAVLNATGKTIV